MTSAIVIDARFRGHIFHIVLIFLLYILTRITCYLSTKYAQNVFETLHNINLDEKCYLYHR